jgi:hypothetical protein
VPARAHELDALADVEIRQGGVVESLAHGALLPFYICSSVQWTLRGTQGMADNDNLTRPRGLGEEDLNITPADLFRLGEDEFRLVFIVSAMDIAGTFGLAALPEGFPADPAEMSTAEMLDAVKKFSDWFDP